MPDYLYTWSNKVAGGGGALVYAHGGGFAKSRVYIYLSLQRPQEAACSLTSFTLATQSFDLINAIRVICMDAWNSLVMINGGKLTH